MQKRNHGPGRDRELKVSTAAQFDALASPVRDQIVQVVVNHEAFRPGEGLSIREIGAQLGRKPASLYRHMEELVKAGLLREQGPQASGGRDASVYAADGAALVLETPARAGPALDALCRYIERMASHAGKESAAAVRTRVRESRGARPDPVQGSASLVGWLDEAQVQRLREMLFEMTEIFGHAQRRPGTSLIAASLLIRPVKTGEA